MSVSSVRSALRFFPRMLSVLTPRRATALITAGLITACGTDLVEPGVATTVTITTPNGDVTATFTSIGDFIQLTFSAKDADGNTVSKTPTWTTSNAAVATVTPTGVITAVGNGTATITATVDGVSGTFSVEVAQVPSAIVVAPGTNTLTALGATVQLTATVQDANANAIANQTVTWTTNDASVATVSATGLVSAVKNGTASITATSGTLTANASITVAQVVSAVTVTPSTVTLNAVGATSQLIASANDANGNPVQGATITWTSSNTNAATVSTTGLVTAVANGGANITATSNNVTGTSAVTVAQTVASLPVTPAGPLSLSPGDTQQLTANPQDANNNPVANATVTWSSNNTNAVTVTQDGLVSAVAQGNAQVSATAGNVTTNVSVQVLGPNTVVISPTGPHTLNAIGATIQLSAEARDANGNPVGGQTFSWSSSNANIATVSATGLVTAVANGPGSPVTITATTAGISASVQVTVNQLATSVTVTSGGQTTLTALGQTLQLTVNAPDANGNQVTPVVCTSNNTNSITVNAQCIVTATANGSAVITATVGGMSGTITLTVSQVPTVINISPQVLPLASINATGTLTAQLLDERGNVVQGVDVTWSSLNPTIASVVEITPETTPSTATVTALANGTAVIEAKTSIPAPAGLAATAQVPVGQVVVPSQSTATVPNGTAGVATQITIQGRDANGNAVNVGGAVVTLDVSGANTQAGIPATDNGNGTYTASYTPTAAGTDMIAIMMDPDGNGPATASPIANSPYTSTVAPGIVSAAHSTAPNPFPGGESGVQTTFLVTLNDAFGNPVGTDAASTAAVVTGTISGGPNAGAAVTAAATSPADGTWTLSYTPLVAGTDVITVTLDPDGPGPIAAAQIGTDPGLPAGSSSPFNSLVAPGLASAANTIASVPAGIAGTATMAVVTMRDANNNPVGTDAKSANAVAAGSVTSGPNTGATVSVVNNGNGTFNLSYTPVQTGTDVIAITLDPDGAGPLTADPISGSPFNSIVTASGPSAAFSSASFSPALPAVAGVPVTITIQARDAQNNVITVGGAAVLVTIQSGPNIGNNPLDPDGPGGVQAGFLNVPAADPGNGTYTIVYTPITSGGIDQIGITLNGSPIGTAPGVPGGPSPFAAQVNPAIANPGASGGVVPAGVSGAVTTGVVTLRDQFGNLVGTDPASANAVVTATVSGGPNNGAVLNATNNGNGTWNVSYTPVVTGTDAITINLDPDGGGAVPASPIGGSPFNSVVAPGQVVPNTTTAVVPGGTAGMQTSIAVTMRDANNNLVGNDAASANSSVTSTVTGGPNNGAVLNAVNNGNGTWTLTYTPTVSGGTDVIAISLDPDGAGPVAGGPISGSPFNSLIAPGSAQPSTTTAVVPGGQAGSVTTAVVTLRDGNGNPVGTDPGSANAVVAGNVTGGPNAGALNAVNNGDGTWNLTYTPLKTGTDPIAITLDVDGAGPAVPTPISGSPFNSVVVPGPVVAARSIATLSTQTVPDITAPGAQTQAGDIISITVQGRDANDNNVTTGTAAVVVTVGGAQPPLTPVVNNPGTGVYTASYVPTVAGVHVITITLDPDAGGPLQPANIGTGAGLNPSPFNATIVPGPPSPVQTTASVPAGKGGVATNITVTVRDVHSNLVTGAAANLAGNVSGGPNQGTALGAAVDNGGGSYTMSYTPLALGTDQITITVDPDLGGPTAPGAISGSPFNSVVTVGPARAANTTGTVPGGVAGQVTSMTVTLFDGGNNPVGNDPGSANAVAAGTVQAGSPNAGAAVNAANNGNGTWTLTYTPTITGTDQIAITLDPDGAGPATADPIGTAPGRPGGPSPFASAVTPDVAAASQTTAAVPAGTAGSQTNIVVTLRDQFGNLVGNDPLSAPVLIAGNVTGGPNAGPLAAVNNNDGTWTLSYTPIGAGADPIDITLDPDGPGGAGPTSISGAPFNSNVAPDVADPASTTAVVPNGTAGMVTTAVVTFNDQFGNPVGNDPKSAAATAAGSITGVNAGATVNAAQATPGVWNVSYTPTVAGADQMAITLDLDGGGPAAPVAIFGSPYATTVSPGAAAAANSSGQDIANQTAGTVATIVVQLRDAQGNNVPSSGAAVVSVQGGVVTSGPNAGTAVTATDNGTGTWNVSYTPTLIGTDVINILLDPDGAGGAPATAIGTAPGVPGGPSPYTVAVVPAAVDAASSTVQPIAPGPHAPAVPITITVQLRDQFGNAISTSQGGPLLAVFQPASPSAAQPLTIQDQGNGTWTIDYVTAGGPGAGNDVLDITFDDGGGQTTVSGSPATVNRT